VWGLLVFVSFEIYAILLAVKLILMLLAATRFCSPITSKSLQRQLRAKYGYLNVRSWWNNSDIWEQP
jgi:hypothetical protein